MAVNPNPNNGPQQAPSNVVAHPAQASRVAYSSGVLLNQQEKPKVEIRRSFFGLLANQQDVEYERREWDRYYLDQEVDHTREGGILLDVKGVRDYSAGAEVLEAVVTDTRPNSLSGRLAEDMASQVVQRWQGDSVNYQRVRDSEAMKILQRR